MNKIEIDKIKILESLMEYKGFNKKAEFAKFLDIKPNVLSNWFTRNTFDENIIKDKIPEVNKIYLLTGEGDVINPINTINKRIQLLIDNLGISVYEFSKKLGNDRPDAIYALLKEGSEIKPSPKTLDKIRETFPNVDYTWLLTGKGDVFLNDKKVAISEDLVTTKNVSKFESKEKLIDKMELFKPVPYYNINVSAGNVTFLDDGLLENQNPDDFMFVPKNIDADIAFPTFGHSMYPEISNGDRVAYKLIKDWSFFNYGMKYLIITDEQRMVKYLKKHDKEGFVLLESRNKEFEPIDMPISSIRAILQVRYIGKIEM